MIPQRVNSLCQANNKNIGSVPAAGHPPQEQHPDTFAVGSAVASEDSCLSRFSQSRIWARSLGALNPANWCAQTPAHDILRPTFAAPGRRSPSSQAAIVCRPLPDLPKSTVAAYLPKPCGLSEASRQKLTRKVTQELDLADAQQLDGRATEQNLRKNIWNRILAEGNTTGERRLIADKLAKLQSDIDTAMADFVMRAKQWVPGMSERDLKRAASNIWPMLCFQALDGRPLEVTQSMLGYSMLYPLTNDIIDEPSISRATKKDFLARFARRISHGDAQAADVPRERDV